MGPILNLVTTIAVIVLGVQTVRVSGAGECASDSCQHGGTCTEGVNAFTCACVPGYNGDMCQTDIDDCATSPCEDDETCTDGVNSYRCASCNAGFTGPGCSTDIDECHSTPCMHEGTCIDNVNSFTCACVDGYTGTVCGTDIDECVVDTTLCANGMCSNTPGSYSCSPCDSGYELNDDSTACNGKDVKSI
eukprot:XP_011676253.1 PREDICTED: fibropellin-3 [Strongylocentrotus purpuratus]